MSVESQKKKLLVVSHAAVLEVNRAIFQNLASIANVEIKMIVPRNWSGSLIRDLTFQKGPADASLEIFPIEVFNSGNGSLYFFKENPRRVLGVWSPDIVFIDEEPWSLAAAQLCWTFRKSDKVFYTKQNLRKKIPWVFRLLERWVFARSYEAFVVTDEVGEVLKNWKNYEKTIHVLPHSFDPKLFYRTGGEERAAIRDVFDAREDQVLIAYLGRLSEEKGLDEFCKAIEMSAANSSERKFLIAGNGPLKEELEEWSQSRADLNVEIRAAYNHHEVGRVFSAIDLMVLPSRTTPTWKEQFGRVIIEAMACGTPLIGSDSGAIPELIKRTGGGLVFRERDAADLAAKIAVLANDREYRHQLGVKGEAFVRENFSHEAVAKTLAKYLDLELLRPS